MGRRRKISMNRKNKRNFQREKVASPKKPMIDMRRLHSFKFELKGILTDVANCDTIFANILSKSMNLGIEDALRFIEVAVEKGNLETEKSDEIIDLLNKYKKYR